MGLYDQNWDLNSYNKIYGNNNLDARFQGENEYYQNTDEKGNYRPPGSFLPSGIGSFYNTPQAPQLNTLDPNWKNELAGYGSTMDRGNIDNKGFNFPSILNFAKGALNRYNPLYEGSKNYDPALQGHVDYMNKYNALSGTGGKTGPYKITRGVLEGKNLVSMFGSNNLIDMYNKQIARMDKTLAGLDDQGWSEKEEDRKRKVFEKRREDAINQKNQAIAEAKGATGDGSGAVTTGGGAVTTGGGGTFNPTLDTGGGGAPGGQPTWHGATAARQAAGKQVAGPGFGSGAFWAEGGRVGYRNGEFVDEDINIQGPNFDVNENIEMAEGPSPFEMRIDELMDEGMSWEEAYQIASEEFGQVAGGESGEGIASLV